ncbi:MAG: hypothetical protein ABIP34_01805 [Rhodoferax sp.]
MQAFADPRVEAVFQGWPQPMRRKLLALRQMIFEVTVTKPGVGVLGKT